MLDTTATQLLSKRIPSNFVVGVATASWQVEGDREGRGSSIWDDFAAVPGNIKDGSVANPACDHVNMLETDLDILADLGVDAYRFSFSWPRVMPGAGAPSAPGLDFYERLIDGLLARDIKPVATLYHWDLPSELQALGGWRNKDIYGKFADYADLLSSRFADRVSMWATFNEPWVSAFLGYATKIHAPGLGDPAAGLEVAYNLMVSHGHAMDALRANGAKSPGIVLNLTEVIAENASVSAIADHVDSLQNRFWLDLLAGRGIDPELMARTSSVTDWSFVEDAGVAKAATPIDWLGVNYYTPFRIVDSNSKAESGAVGQDFSLFPGTPSGGAMQPREPRTEMGWEIHPSSMTQTLVQTAQRLPDVPIYITENGAAFNDEFRNGEVLDYDRVEFLTSHINAALNALDQGVELRGYFAWSLMDNIEWAEGLTKRFGIYYVDHETQIRTPKLSAGLIKALSKH